MKDPKWAAGIKQATSIWQQCNRRYASDPCFPEAFLTSDLPAEFEKGATAFAYTGPALPTLLTRVLGRSIDSICCVINNSTIDLNASSISSLLLHEWVHGLCNSVDRSPIEAAKLLATLRYRHCLELGYAQSDALLLANSSGDLPRMPKNSGAKRGADNPRIHFWDGNHGIDWCRGCVNVAYSARDSGIDLSWLRFASQSRFQAYVIALQTEVNMRVPLRDKLNLPIPGAFRRLWEQDKQRVLQLSGSY